MRRRVLEPDHDRVPRRSRTAQLWARAVCGHGAAGWAVGDKARAYHVGRSQNASSSGTTRQKHNVVEAIEIDTAVAKTVASGVESPVLASPDGERVCYSTGHELLCTRIADEWSSCSATARKRGVGDQVRRLRPPPAVHDARRHNKVVSRWPTSRATRACCVG